MLMNFSLIGSDDKRLEKLIIQKQMKYYMTNTLYTKVRQIADTIKVNSDQANIMKKSVWKERCKEQIKAKAEERIKIKVNEGIKLRFRVNYRFETKHYIKEAAGHTAVKIMKIRLNMMNYKGEYKDDESLMWPYMWRS